MFPEFKYYVVRLKTAFYDEKFYANNIAAIVISILIHINITRAIDIQQ